MSALILERLGRVTSITLNRSDSHNALTPAMLDDLSAMVRAFDDDTDQRVLVITGAGSKAFCSGADLATMLDGLDAGSFAPKSLAPDIAGIGACRKPVIAAINGLAVGGGMEIAMCCDIRIASDTAWFALPEVSYGFLAGVAAVLLPRLLPLGVVMDMMLAGERLKADDALRYGFVSQLVPPAVLQETVLAKAERIAQFSQPALWGSKQAVRYWHDTGRMAHHEYYDAIISRVMLAGDVQEGLQAFREKRKPNFTCDAWPKPSGNN